MLRGMVVPPSFSHLQHSNFIELLVTSNPIIVVSIKEEKRKLHKCIGNFTESVYTMSDQHLGWESYLVGETKFNWDPEASVLPSMQKGGSIVHLTYFLRIYWLSSGLGEHMKSGDYTYKALGRDQQLQWW